MDFFANTFQQAASTGGGQR